MSCTASAPLIPKYATLPPLLALILMEVIPVGVVVAILGLVLHIRVMIARRARPEFEETSDFI